MYQKTFRLSAFTVTVLVVAAHCGDVAAARFFWSEYEAHRIMSANLDGSDVQIVTDTGVGSAPIGVAVDPSAQQVYWAEQGGTRIRRANYDGSNVTDIVTSGIVDPSDVALDLVNGHLYWTDFGNDLIQRSDLDGSNQVTIFDLSGLPSTPGPFFLDLDLVNQMIYWTDFNDGPAEGLYRGALDGSGGPEYILDTGPVAGPNSLPSGIDLDVAGGKIYWTDRNFEKIFRTDLDGTNSELLYLEPNGIQPRGLELDIVNGKVYWVNQTSDEIRVGNMDGSGSPVTVVHTGEDPYGLAIDFVIPEPSTLTLGVIGFLSLAAFVRRRRP